jgi:methionine biosynthesis protein MetW
MMLRHDFELITRWVPEGATVLDLGCGDGALLANLQKTRNVRGYGVEIDPQAVNAAIDRGVNVLQFDLESGLAIFADQHFDCVILSLTLQAMKRTEGVMREMVRVGREAIVTIPNFGYWQHRIDLLGGRMPKSDELPFEWYDTPNVHLCTLADFEAFCHDLDIECKARVVLAGQREITLLPNLRGSLAVYRCAAKSQGKAA